MSRRKRLEWLESLRRGDTFIPVSMAFLEPLNAVLDAIRDGRPYSELARPPSPAAPAKPQDPTSPGSRLAEQLAQLRKQLASDPDDAALTALLAQARRETIRAIEREQRDAERRQRQRLKRQRRAQRKALAAVQPDAQAPAPM